MRAGHKDPPGTASTRYRSRPRAEGSRIASKAACRSAVRSAYPVARIADLHCWRKVSAAGATSWSATLSWTISRRSVVQRWPAVPTAPEQDRPLGQLRGRLTGRRSWHCCRPARGACGRTFRATVPASGPCPVEPVAETSVTADLDQRLARRSASPWTSVQDPPARPSNRSTALRISALRPRAMSGVFSRRLPDDGVAADERQQRHSRPRPRPEN